MAYSTAVYQAAMHTLSTRRQQAEDQAEQHQHDFYRLEPRAREIDHLLASTALAAGRAVLSGQSAAVLLQQLKEKNLGLQQELAGLLAKHQLPPDYLEPHYQCAACKDTGLIDGRMCRCLKDLLKKEAYQQLNALTPLSLCTFEDFSTHYYPQTAAGGISPQKRATDILAYCRRYAAAFSLSSDNLLMQGATGLGKTHLSLAIAGEVIQKGFGVVYGSTQTLLARLERDRFQRGGCDPEEGSETHLTQCDLLILDDLGTEFTTSFTTAALYQIINSRLLLSRPTIISTNLSLKELEQAYSERFVSRVMGSYTRLEFLGVDIRQQKRLEQLKR